MLNRSPSAVPFCLCILGLLLFFFAFTHFTVNLSLMLLKLLWFALLKILQLEGIFFLLWQELLSQLLSPILYFSLMTH